MIVNKSCTRFVRNRRKSNVKTKKDKVYLFILEAPKAFECADEIFEGDILKGISKLLKIPTYHSFIKNKNDFIKEIKFIESSEKFSNGHRSSIILHLSFHGNCDGFAMGPDEVEWDELFEITKQIFSRFNKLKGNRYLTLSACDSDQQRLTKLIEQSNLINAPEFIFTCKGTPSWDESGLQWATFYSKLVKLDLKKDSAELRNDIKKIIEKINGSVFPGITYFRKNSLSKYKKFSG